jgi:hypothetical protein
MFSSWFCIKVSDRIENMRKKKKLRKILTGGGGVAVEAWPAELVEAVHLVDALVAPPPPLLSPWYELPLTSTY